MPRNVTLNTRLQERRPQWEMKWKMIADKYENLQGRNKFSGIYQQGCKGEQKAGTHSNVKAPTKEMNALYTDCCTWIKAHVRMHLLAFSASGLVFNPVVTVTPRVVGVWAGVFRGGWIPPPAHIHTVTDTGFEVRGPILNSLALPLSPFPFCSSLYPLHPHISPLLWR